MKVIFATTNKRKIEDFLDIINSNHLDIEILTLDDIKWNLGEIEENGTTLEENSLIKAKAIYQFCQKNNIYYPIMSDDAGLYVNSLNGEPGIYTARYADRERQVNPSLPSYECVHKLLRNLEGIKDRSAYYRCVVTFMYPNGTFFQESAISKGNIALKIQEPIKKPYFYSVFILENTNSTFNQLGKETLKNTYRYQAIKQTLHHFIEGKC